MKTGNNRIVKAAAVVLAVIFLSSSLSAMNFQGKNVDKAVKTEIPEIMVQNLAAGLESGNLGLKTDCIYFAGFYEIEGLVKPLVKQFAEESNPDTRILIALALYKIGNEDAMNAFKKLVKNDTDPAVQTIVKAMLNELQNNQSYSNNVINNWEEFDKRKINPPIKPRS